MNLEIDENELQELLESFPKLLKKVRQGIGITQKDLAERNGVQPSYISMLETGERRPSRKKVLQLVKNLRVDEVLSDVLLMAAGLSPSKKTCLAVLEKVSSSMQRKVYRFTIKNRDAS